MRDKFHGYVLLIPKVVHRFFDLTNKVVRKRPNFGSIMKRRNQVLDARPPLVSFAVP